MADWIQQYTAALEARDVREQAHRPYIDACMLLVLKQKPAHTESLCRHRSRRSYRAALTTATTLCYHSPA
jgi:hypothetical protein